MERNSPPRPAASGWLISLVLIACGLQLIELRTRSIDPDEFEHLHAASMVARGQVPYRDFFEHHGPLLYYVIQPLFRLFGQGPGVLWGGRCLMWLCSLATLGLTARQANQIGGPICGWTAAALLAWTTIFHSKGIELRPDVPAMLLIQLAITLVIEGKGRFRSALIAGILAGLATLCTQKAIVPIAGLAIAATVRELLTGNARRAIVPAVGLALGGGIAWASAFAAFGAVGAAGDLWHGTVVQLIKWPVRSQRWDHLRPTLAADFAVWFAGLLEIGSSIRHLRNGEAWESGRNTYATVGAFSIFALFWVKATYPQYYLLWFPVLSALAAVRILAWRGETPPRLVRIAGIALSLALPASQIALWRRAWNLDQTGALPALVEVSGRMSLIGPLVVPGVVLLLMMTAWLALRRRWSVAVALLSALGMFHAVLRNIDTALRTNGEQVRRVEVVQRHVPPDGTALDGFSGFAVLRPHAYYYWWINEYSLALMTRAEREGELLEALERTPPSAILFDEHLRLLPESVTSWIRERYEPLADEPWLWLPRTGIPAS